MNYSIPKEYKPISAWGYFGYNILYAIPVVGLLILIINAIGAKNMNVRNYARSFFCGFLILLLLCIVLFILAQMGYVKIDISFVNDYIK